MSKRVMRDLLLEEQLLRDEAWESKPVASAPGVAQPPNTKTWRKSACLRIADADGRVIRSYRWCLELPVPIVLVVCWLFGVALIGLCAGALYLLLWTSVGVAAGA
jgi:hypothetical protein